MADVTIESAMDVTATFDGSDIEVTVNINCTDGDGDMLASVYDPAGGAAQVAFESDLADYMPADPADVSEDTLTDESVLQFWKSALKKITWANIKATLKTYFDTLYTAIGDVILVDQSTEQRFTSGVPKLATDRTITDIHHLVDLKLLNESVGALGSRYYMTSDVCCDSSYYLTAAEAPAAFSIDFANVLTGVVAQWISPTGSTPSKLLKGQYEWDIFAARTDGNKSINVYWELVKIDAALYETILATSATSDVIVAKRRVLIPLTLADDVSFLSTDRVVGKIYATVGGGAATTLTLYGGGTDNSHWEVPTNLEILSSVFAPVHNPIEISTDLEINSTNIATYNGSTLFLTSAYIGTKNITVTADAGITEDIAVIQCGNATATWVQGAGTTVTGNKKTNGIGTATVLTKRTAANAFYVIGGVA